MPPRSTKKKQVKTVEQLALDLEVATKRMEQHSKKVEELQANSGTKKSTLKSASTALDRASATVNNLKALLAELKASPPDHPSNTSTVSLGVTPSVPDSPPSAIDASMPASSISITSKGEVADSDAPSNLTSVDMGVTAANVAGLTNTEASGLSQMAAPGSTNGAEKTVNEPIANPLPLDANIIATKDLGECVEGSVDERIEPVEGSVIERVDERVKHVEHVDDLVVGSMDTCLDECITIPAVESVERVDKEVVNPMDTRDDEYSTTAVKSVAETIKEVILQVVNSTSPAGKSADVPAVDNTLIAMDVEVDEVLAHQLEVPVKATNKRPRVDDEGESEVSSGGEDEDDDSEGRGDTTGPMGSMSNHKMRFKAEFSSVPLYRWKGNAEERAESNARYLRFMAIGHILHRKFSTIKPHEMDQYITAGTMQIQLWGCAVNAWQIPGLKLHKNFREALRDNQKLLPACASTSITLIEHILTTPQGTMKCKGCAKKALRTQLGRALQRARQEEAKLHRKRVKLEREDVDLGSLTNTSITSSPHAEEPTAPISPHVTGDYLPYMGEAVGGGQEWVLDCGCSFDMACWSFFMWKTWWAQHVETGLLEPMAAMPPHPREGAIQNFSRFLSLDIADLMNWRGTGFWDINHQITIRRLQHERLGDLIKDLEGVKKTKRGHKWEGEGWPDVESNINVQSVLGLRRVRIL